MSQSEADLHFKVGILCILCEAGVPLKFTEYPQTACNRGKPIGIDIPNTMASAFFTARPRLFAVAYRMRGRAAETKDWVQCAFEYLARHGPDFGNPVPAKQ